MAERLLSHVVSDLCLGKPALRSLSVTATVADALLALKSSEDNFISVWSCSGGGLNEEEECQCVGKICMVDVICYLSQEENLLSPSLALKSLVSILMPEAPGLVMHIEPSSSLLEAIDLILKGAQNLVVPIKTRRRVNHQQKLLQTIHGGREYCWLTQEDMMRFLLSSIGLFSPIPALSIESLNIISTDIITIHYHSPASEANGPISRSLSSQTSVAIIDPEGILIGEISPSTLACCDETVAAALTTLSTGDLMAYIDCGGPPEDLVKVVKERLKKRGLGRMLEEFSITPPSSPNLPLASSDEESSNGGVIRSGKYNRSLSYSARMVRRAEAIVCNPRSSLVAVMIQAIAHRVNYVWVIEDDGSLIGIVTFYDMLKVFRDQLESMA
ncbi:CBS domain-containing CBSX5 -like protein [Tripterygium wilfordii]|uniref:CBS domain-containing CBSX5 -like protein n=1 Tax=Tripterygium wilfordii TaxID=458696 RepID=A0A7J7C1P8_TRIWF|nr:CBS domain-containing protein CBSX5-like [Tripterygium wilfordii]KAF5728028.1 CBS domain-containing CBSX5 -like protein [Tripterygium wilfordii]